MKVAAKLALLAIPTLTEAQMNFEDFETPQDWVYVADGVMGGVSQGTARLTDEGAVHLTGQVSTANNGGFIQVRRRFDTPWPDTATGLRLSVKGNGETYYVFLRVPNMARRWYSYRQSFETTGEWTDVTLPFDDFTASHDGMPEGFDPTEVYSIGLVAYGADFDADLSVRQIDLY